MNILSLLASDNYRTYNVEIARKLKSISAAIILSEIAQSLQFHEKKGELISHPQHGDGWIYLTHEKCEERTILTRKEQDKAFAILESFNLIEKKVWGAPPLRHFRLNIDAIFTFFGIEKKSTNLPLLDKSICPKRTNRSVPLGQIGHIERKNNIEEQYSLSDHSIGLANLLFSKIKENDPKFKHRVNVDLWASIIDLMIRRDHADPEDIAKVIIYATQDPFWGPIIISGKKLRTHFVTLRKKMETPKSENIDEPAIWKRENVDKFNEWKNANPDTFKNFKHMGDYIYNQNNPKDVKEVFLRIEPKLFLDRFCMVNKLKMKKE